MYHHRRRCGTKNIEIPVARISSLRCAIRTFLFIHAEPQPNARQCDAVAYKTTNSNHIKYIKYAVDYCVESNKREYTFKRHIIRCYVWHTASTRSTLIHSQELSLSLTHTPRIHISTQTHTHTQTLTQEHPLNILNNEAFAKSHCCCVRCIGLRLTVSLTLPFCTTL